MLAEGCSYPVLYEGGWGFRCVPVNRDNPLQVDGNKGSTVTGCH